MTFLANSSRSILANKSPSRPIIRSKARHGSGSIAIRLVHLVLSESWSFGVSRLNRALTGIDRFAYLDRLNAIFPRFISIFHRLFRHLYHSLDGPSIPLFNRLGSSLILLFHHFFLPLFLLLFSRRTRCYATSTRSNSRCCLCSIVFCRPIDLFHRFRSSWRLFNGHISRLFARYLVTRCVSFRRGRMWTDFGLC